MFCLFFSSGVKPRASGSHWASWMSDLAQLLLFTEGPFSVSITCCFHKLYSISHVSFPLVLRSTETCRFCRILLFWLNFSRLLIFKSVSSCLAEVPSSGLVLLAHSSAPRLTPPLSAFTYRKEGVVDRVHKAELPDLLWKVEVTGVRTSEALWKCLGSHASGPQLESVQEGL